MKLLHSPPLFSSFFRIFIVFHKHQKKAVGTDTHLNSRSSEELNDSCVMAEAKTARKIAGHPLFASSAWPRQSEPRTPHGRTLPFNWTTAMRVLLPDTSRAASAARREEIWRWMGGPSTKAVIPFDVLQEGVERMVLQNFEREHKGAKEHRMLVFLRAAMRAAADEILSSTSNAFHVMLSRETGTSFGLGVIVMSAYGYPEISHLQEGSVAASCRQIEIGDKVLSLNGRSVASEADFRALLPPQKLTATIQLRRGADGVDFQMFRILLMRLHQYLDVHTLLSHECGESPWSPVSFTSFDRLLHERRHKDYDAKGRLMSSKECFEKLLSADTSYATLSVISFDILARWSMSTQLVRPGSGVRVKQQRMPSHWIDSGTIGIFGYADSPRSRKPPPPPDITPEEERPIVSNLAAPPELPPDPKPKPPRARTPHADPAAYPGPPPPSQMDEDLVTISPRPFPMFPAVETDPGPEPEPAPRPRTPSPPSSDIPPPMRPAPPPAPPPPPVRRPARRVAQMGLGTTAWATTGMFALLSPREHQKIMGATPIPRHENEPPVNVVDQCRPSQNLLHAHIMAQANYERTENKYGSQFDKEVKEWKLNSKLLELARRVNEERARLRREREDSTESKIRL